MNHERLSYLLKKIIKFFAIKYYLCIIKLYTYYHNLGFLNIKFILKDFYINDYFFIKIINLYLILLNIKTWQELEWKLKED